MATGIVGTDRDMLLWLAYTLEGRFEDVAECVDEGEGPHETRPQYRRIYNHTALQWHPDGILSAVLLLDEAVATKWAELKTELQDKVTANTATAQETEFAALSATTLDETWGLEPPVYQA